MKERLRVAARRGTQRGDITASLIAGMVVSAFLLVAALAVMTMIKRSEDNRDFVLAEQMANSAIADASYQLTEGMYAPRSDGSTGAISLPEYPLDGEPRIGVGTAAEGEDGIVSAGRWRWHVEVPPEGAGSPDRTREGVAQAVHLVQPLTLVSVGCVADMNLRADWSETPDDCEANRSGVEREVRSELIPYNVRSVHSDVEESTITYRLAPRSTFLHAVFGEDSVQTVGSTGTVIDGSVGSNGTVTTNTPPTGGTYLYGFTNEEADFDRCNEGDGSLCGKTRSVAVHMEMDETLPTEMAQHCAGQEFLDWTASEEAEPTLVANNNIACYSNLTIDQDTNVISSGFLDIYVSDTFTIEDGASLTAANSTVTVYTSSGDVAVEGVTAGGQTVDMFLYAPNATCELGEVSGHGGGESPPSTLTINGGVACKEVVLYGASSINSEPYLAPVAGAPLSTLPISDRLYNRRVWYATDSRECFVNMYVDNDLKRQECR